MSPPSPLFMPHKAEELKTLFRWPHLLMTETDLIPNPVAEDSERTAGKSKKREGFRKPNSELPPSRNSGTAIGGAAMSGMSRSGDPALSISGVVADVISA